jgi:hypothetical protein
MFFSIKKIISLGIIKKNSEPWVWHPSNLGLACLPNPSKT